MPARSLLRGGGKAQRRSQLNLLDPPHFHMAIDAVSAMRGAEKTRGLAPDDLPAVLRKTRAGFHPAVAGMAAAGNDIVMDHVLSETWRLQDCLDLSPRSTSPSSRCAALSWN